MKHCILLVMPSRFKILPMLIQEKLVAKNAKALIIVDLQNDFLPGGALPVAEGDRIIPIINQLLQLPFDVKVASQDWHPKDHHSFASIHGKSPGESILLNGLEQVLWPIHCVQGTKGAELAAELHQEKIEAIFYKGTDRHIDSYSTFFDNGHRKSTGLSDFLNAKNIKEIYIAGLATDYCVKYSAIDGSKLGFLTFVIADACRGIELNQGDINQALTEMKEAGARPITSQQLLQHLKAS